MPKREETMNKSTLAATTLAVAAAAGTGGIASPARVEAWYSRLRKPAYQPPRIAFPVVWTALYGDIATTSAVAIDRLEATGQHDKARRTRCRAGRQPCPQRRVELAVLSLSQTGRRGAGRRCTDREQCRPRQARRRRRPKGRIGSAPLSVADLLLELHAVPISATAAMAATVAVLVYRVVTVVLVFETRRLGLDLLGRVLRSRRWWL